MGWESSGVVGFHLGPLVQGQMRTAKRNSGYNQAWGQVHGAKYKYNYFAKLQVQVQVLISRVKCKYFEKLQVQVLL